jgi:acyl carrier protein
MANKDAVVAKVIDLIATHLNVSPGDVKPDNAFIDDLGMDSLDIVDFVMLIEKEFDVEIPDEDAERISTVQDAIDYLVDHLPE